MTCHACGEHPKKHCGCKDCTRAVMEITNPEKIILLRKVVIPATMGDDTEVPASVGKYCNVVLWYEANKHTYLYSSDGIPTLLEAEVPQEVIDRIANLEDEDVILHQEISAVAQDLADLKNNPDVVDIVDTYADLQSYDTSTLTDKDVIRVLADETHNGDSSFYRWDKTANTWDFIGVVNTTTNTIFYADVSESGGTRYIYKNSDMTGTVSAQDILNANLESQVILRMSTSVTPGQFNDAYLQNTYVGQNDYQFLFLDNRSYYEYDATATSDTAFMYSKSTIQLQLTAGANITISGNTISATDTTYNTFVGTDGQTAGVAGLVPAPATTDAGKVLGASGAWVEGIEVINAQDWSALWQ